MKKDINITIKSVAKNIERLTGFTVDTKNEFFIHDEPYKNEQGMTVYPWKSINGIVIILYDDTEERPRVVRQVAFDTAGNHYRFAGSDGRNCVFENVRDDKYGGFTALEAIELVRLRDAIIAV